MEYPIYGGLDTTDARGWRDELWSYAHQPESSAGLVPEEQRALLEPVIERLLRHVQSVEEKGHGGQAALGYQVLAVMLVEAGCTLSASFRQRLLEGIAADTAGQGSPQAPSDTVRTHSQNVSLLREVLLAYDLSGGTPAVLPPFKPNRSQPDPGQPRERGDEQPQQQRPTGQGHRGGPRRWPKGGPGGKQGDKRQGNNSAVNPSPGNKPAGNRRPEGSKRGSGPRSPHRAPKGPNGSSTT
jgi:hypothetical protein